MLSPRRSSATGRTGARSRSPHVSLASVSTSWYAPAAAAALGGGSAFDAASPCPFAGRAPPSPRANHWHSHAGERRPARACAAYDGSGALGASRLEDAGACLCVTRVCACVCRRSRGAATVFSPSWPTAWATLSAAATPRLCARAAPSLCTSHSLCVCAGPHAVCRHAWRLDRKARP
jgi:hypothetical protein